MSDTPGQVEIPIDAGSVNLPEASPNQAVTPDRPQPPANEPSIKPRDNSEPIAKNTREAIERAAAKVEAAEKNPPAKVEAPVKPRADDGKFAPKEVAAQKQLTDGQEPLLQTAQPERAASKYEAPARFHDVAKTDWSKAPESVQAEVARVLKENEDGITKYKASSERYEALRQYDDLAKANGKDLTNSLKQIVEVENAFARNPLEGFKKVAEWAGYNPQEVAAHILGQDPNQQVADAHRQLEAARAEIAQLKAVQEAPKQVQTFAQEFDSQHGAGHFEKLAGDIAELIESGVVSDLKAAATMANMMYRRSQPTASDANQSQALIPPQTVSAQTATAAPVLPNPAGQKSVTGAPGSLVPNSTTVKPSGRSTRDAILNAAKSLGA